MKLLIFSNKILTQVIGTSKIGSDDGRSGGSAVVDLNAQVYGTDNLFVVDASIFPGHVTTNPSAYIVVIAERAAEKILALTPATAVAKYGQCGGIQYSGSFQCAAGSTCQKQNDYYSQVSLALIIIDEFFADLLSVFVKLKCILDLRSCI